MKLRPPWQSVTASACLGYTFVELLIVLALIALLLGIAFPRYTSAVDGAKERARAQNLDTLRDALDKFRADQGRYPAELAELVQKQYLRKIPLDPVTGTSQWRLVPTAQKADGGMVDILPPEDLLPASPVPAEAPT
ncbi:prepilin-type N-terminal cleavage/methylation domain-containing protein [Ramlibacter humi]|uniref:Prepilin-type N-terminal cleavage/methylation domain-containing protein n=1 Tax=Ramlibacter humi TaxID=2530451 RepID=A0A4Z0BCH7_9BURK|nr:prepilin-type N-terminal cleavage/methylation domain-containing protein [Ramlibacter humi]TFY96361.1 prepilin-type N-terminal cleavage/methylation domain-containing protein [Ramlibacter humi]